MAKSPSRFEFFLCRCRRVVVLSTFLRGVVAALITAGAVGFFTLVFGPMVLYFLVPLCALIIAYYAWPLLRLRGDSLALFVDRAFPDLRDGAINSVQLSRENASPYTRFSRPLISASIAQAEERMCGDNPWDLFQGKALTKGFLILVAILMMYVGLYENVKSALYPSYKGTEGSLLVGDVTITYRYPTVSYTHLTLPTNREV